MKLIFYDNQRVVDVREAAFVVNYTSTSVEYILPQGGTSTLVFGTQCQMLRDNDGDACGMLAWKGIDTSVLDDVLLQEYLDD